MPDDPIQRFEAMLGAFSKMTSEEGDPTLEGRCPQCEASDFIHVPDLYDNALRRLEEGDSPEAVHEGGLSNARIVAKFKPPMKKTAVTRTLLVLIPLAIVTYLVYWKYGEIPSEFAGMVSIVIVVTVFMTMARRVSDDFYDRRAKWRKLYMCRRCGQLVAA